MKWTLSWENGGNRLYECMKRNLCCWSCGWCWTRPKRFCHVVVHFNNFAVSQLICAQEKSLREPVRSWFLLFSASVAAWEVRRFAGFCNKHLSSFCLFLFFIASPAGSKNHQRDRLNFVAFPVPPTGKQEDRRELLTKHFYNLMLILLTPLCSTVGLVRGNLQSGSRRHFMWCKRW